MAWKLCVTFTLLFLLFPLVHLPYSKLAKEVKVTALGRGWEDADASGLEWEQAQQSQCAWSLRPGVPLLARESTLCLPPSYRPPVPPLILPTPPGPDFLPGAGRATLCFIVLMHRPWWWSAGQPGGYPRGVLTASFANPIPFPVSWQSSSVPCTSLSASLAQQGVPHQHHMFRWKLPTIQYEPAWFWGCKNKLSWPI